MLKIAVIDLSGEANAPVAVTLDALRVADVVAGRVQADVACFGSGRIGGPGRREPWTALQDRWDVVIVPGLGLSYAKAPWTALSTAPGKRLVDSLSIQHGKGALLAASCTGTFALAEAGLLDGRFATTSWWLSADFRLRYPAVLLRAGALTTEDGRILCAGGSLAQVDLMLMLIGKLFGAELATRVAQYLVSPWRGPQSVVAEIGQTRIADPLVAAAVHFVQAKLDQDFSVEDIALAVATSSRTLHRRIQANLGVSAVGLVRRIRGEEAMRLLRETELSLARIADRVGYRNEATLRSLVIELSGQTPAALRRQSHGRATRVISTS